MKSNFNKITLILGITLFAMFFGAGNLIFPSYLGFESRSLFIPAFIGFSVTAILLPMLGINVIVKRKGLINLGNSISPWFASLITFLIYIAIGPLLAIPRTSSVSFAIAIQPFIAQNHIQFYIILYSIFFFSLSAFIAFKPDKLSTFLGKITAPILILLIIVIFFATIFNGVEASTAIISSRYQSNVFLTAFLDGYQTMDTIAALNFGIIFVVNIESNGFKNFDEKKRVTLKSSIIASILLAFIYLALGLIGMVSPLKEATNGTEILTYAVKANFGLVGMIILAVVFVLACFNTCTALISCCSNYFHLIIPKVSYKKWVIVFALSSAIISNAGLNTILKFSIPILNAIYPLSISLIVIGLFNLDTNPNFFYARKLMIFIVALFSVIPVVLGFFNIQDLFNAFPLNNVGLVWVVPGILALVFGYFVQKMGLIGKKSLK
ncbi:MAG: branched-chain amino acid transport system II carrier protein [Spirochaetaceae bacterium]|nr:branched-chain amino acid transport system II carrier protein [Spirochaetaceae bacterium]